MVERVAMLSADVITSPSLDLAQYVAHDLGVKVEDIDIVYNPIDAAEFSPEGARADFGKVAPDHTLCRATGGPQRHSLFNRCRACR